MTKLTSVALGAGITKTNSHRGQDEARSDSGAVKLQDEDVFLLQVGGTARGDPDGVIYEDDGAD